MKIVYIIPGYGESYLKQKGYIRIANFFKAVGVKPIHVNIKWILKKPIDFVSYNKQFLKLYNRSKNNQVYVLGFSFGAIIALLIEPLIKPDKLILCSLSPYFVEDYKNLKPAWLKWWKKNFINDINFSLAVKKIHAETYLIVGGRESKPVITRAKAAKKAIKNSHLIISQGSKHNISGKSYLKTLEKVIKII